MSDTSWVVTALVASLVVLAGCGGAVPADAGTPSPTPSPTDRVGATATPPDGGPTDTAANGTLEVHVINVGQSSATLVVSPSGETMLVDSGDFTDDGEYVLQYLEQRNVTRIDHFVVSHADADHIGGNAAIIEYYETQADGVGAVYDPGIAANTRTYEEYLDAVVEYNVSLFETRAGDAFPFAGVDIRVLSPPEPYLDGGARNENSIVLQLTHGDTTFLLTGDGEADAERYLVETYGDSLQSTVLLAGHHGSASSSTAPFLDAVRPRVTAISSAYDSQYGHPSPEVLERFAARDVPAYWTATHGHIAFVSDGERIAIRTQRAAPTDPLALRGGDATAPGTTLPLTTRATLDAATGTPVAADGGTTTTADDSRLTIARINADAAGDDRANLDDEYVVLRNDGDRPLDLTGWTMADAADHEYAFPDGFTLDPGATVTVHTGSGADTATDLYWGLDRPVWNNDGDTVVLSNASGDRVRTETYP
ncbi:lamin tail domain-containing protein [Haloarcula marina]|uniref:lamin tail domain-containing protein n=1 Tax=Haloarcula marina TaxID=2961574 RepID=UPI0020B84FAC|nr:lamin tail domain-containing protein [Halomicroarcula marina]